MLRLLQKRLQPVPDLQQWQRAAGTERKHHLAEQSQHFIIFHGQGRSLGNLQLRFLGLGRIRIHRLPFAVSGDGRNQKGLQNIKLALEDNRSFVKKQAASFGKHRFGYFIANF
ncbi:hypothetical protein D3C81_1751030 [compost metagenome]